MFILEDKTLIRYFRKKLIDWENKNFANFPWRFCDNKWHSLAVEIMLQRTKAEQVLPVFLDFCNKYPFPELYHNDKEANIFNSLGLQQRNKEFKLLAKELIDKEIPENKETLLKLPGVGEYVASAYLSLHQKQWAVIIDSNVVRLYGRFFGFETDGETRRKKWFIELAEQLTPKKNFYFYNYGLLDLPRNLCKIKSTCKDCPLNRKCKYYKNCIKF
jgi:hhH-GPD family protein